MSIRYASHHLVLEPSQARLLLGDQVLEPEPKVFAFLAYLMRNPGRVVTKPELLDALWSGEVVSEGVLTRCVSCVRRLLDDDARAPTFIRTVHGRGYEFIAPVSARACAPSSLLGTDSANPERAAELARHFAWALAQSDGLDAWQRALLLARLALVLCDPKAGPGVAAHAATRSGDPTSRSP